MVHRCSIALKLAAILCLQRGCSCENCCTIPQSARTPEPAKLQQIQDEFDDLAHFLKRMNQRRKKPRSRPPLNARTAGADSPAQRRHARNLVTRCRSWRSGNGESYCGKTTIAHCRVRQSGICWGINRTGFFLTHRVWTCSLLWCRTIARWIWSLAVPG